MRIDPLTAHFVCVLVELEHVHLVIAAESKRGEYERVPIGVALERGEAARMVFELVRGVRGELAEHRGRASLAFT